ncbi:MAG: isopenicillin N synthase family dioxygenase [Bernardetiaceae bacterium]
MQYDQIPSLDLSDFMAGDPAQKKRFVQQLGDAFSHIGFVAIKNHGLSETQRQALYRTVEDFFRLPEAVKQKYERPQLNYQRGYTGKRKETAKGFSKADLKEFYHIGQAFDPAQAHPVLSDYPANVFPEEVPDFAEATCTAFVTLERAGLELLRAIAAYLHLPEDYFDDKATLGNSILRPIHYFPLDPDQVEDGAVRAAAHGDINLITLLMGASADGLQVQRLDGEWISVTALPEQVVVNVGDMLSRLTNNVLKSTIHRVVNPPREQLSTSRYSIPFFMHPRSAMDLSCLPQCITEDNPKQYPDITAGEFLEERLRELGLLK